VCCLVAGSVWAQDNKSALHIPDGQGVSFNWDVKDGLGNRWDINGVGGVSSGVNNAYSNGMRLTITDGNEFSGGGSRMSEDKREIEIGPWQYGNVRVSRRIYVDEKQGYCRWVDIFENESSEPFRVALCYRNRMGSTIHEVAGSRGAKNIEAKDWAFATMYRENSNRPVIVHVIASPAAKTKPRIQWKSGTNEVMYFYDLTVEPNKPVALCFFQSQQPNPEKAKAFMKSFDVAAELGKLPAPLREILLNMPSGGTVMDRLEIPRDAKDDLAVLRNGDQIRGTIATETFVVKTVFGEMKIPADKVLGVLMPQEEDAYAQVALTDGQILAGDLTSSVVIKRDSENSVTLAPTDFRSAAFKISPEKPADVKVADQFVVLRNGQRLYLADKPSLEFSTLHGKIKLDADTVSRIVTDTPDGGLHRAMFRNGSVLSGLLTADKFSAKLALGATLNVSINMVARVEFSTEEAASKATAQVLLRNEDAVMGTLTDADVTVQTETGKQKVKLTDISAMEFDAENMEKVTLTLNSNSTMSGKLERKNLKFKMDNGPEINLFVGHIATIAITAAEESDEGDTPAEAAPTDDAPMTEEAAKKAAEAAKAAKARAVEVQAVPVPVALPVVIVD